MQQRRHKTVLFAVDITMSFTLTWHEFFRSQKKERSKTAVESQNGDPGPSIKKFFYVDILEFSVEGESHRF